MQEVFLFLLLLSVALSLNVNDKAIAKSDNPFKTILDKCVNAAHQVKLYEVEKLYYSCNSDIFNAPLYTIHHLSNTELLKPNAKRPDEAWEENGVNNGGVFERVLNSNFDRGHLVPNNDQRSSSKKVATFSTLNRAPQLAPINRGFWRTIEHSLVNTIMKQKYEDVYVMTGCLYSKTWLTTHEFNNEKHSVSVPTHYYKIVVLRDHANLEGGFCVKQQNKKYESSKDYDKQDADVYPVIMNWNECLNDSDLKSTASHLNVKNPNHNILSAYKIELLDDVNDVTTIKGGVLEPDCTSQKHISFKTVSIRDKLQVNFDATCPVRCKYAKVVSGFKVTDVNHEEIISIIESHLIVGSTTNNFYLCPHDHHTSIHGSMTVTCSADKSNTYATAKVLNDKQQSLNTICEHTPKRLKANISHKRVDIKTQSTKDMAEKAKKDRQEKMRHAAQEAQSKKRQAAIASKRGLKKL